MNRARGPRGLKSLLTQFSSWCPMSRACWCSTQSLRASGATWSLGSSYFIRPLQCLCALKKRRTEPSDTRHRAALVTKSNHPLRNEAPLNCVSLRFSLDYAWRQELSRVNGTPKNGALDSAPRHSGYPDVGKKNQGRPSRRP